MPYEPYDLYDYEPDYSKVAVNKQDFKKVPDYSKQRPGTQQYKHKLPDDRKA